MNDLRMSAEYQRNVSDFVHREVIYCVSSLVWELAQNYEAFPNYEDDLLNAFTSSPDYEEAISETVRNWSVDECIDYLVGRGFSVSDTDPINELRDAVIGDAIDEDAEQFCYEQNIDADDYRREIFEHWIVSHYLARELAYRGEKTIGDFFGMTIWGRATTGQSIAIDSVICDIYDSLHSDKSAAA